MSNEQKAKDYADGLRKLAAYVEAHPEIALPEEMLSVWGMSSKQEAGIVMRALGHCEKEYSAVDLFFIKRAFGPITLRYVFNRSTVCERVVVGTEEIPEQVIPAKAEEVIPASKREIVKWECRPLLEPESAPMTEASAA